MVILTEEYRRCIFINKQKFLAELGRLLTFMYDEDRQTALSMYERMFDETADEPGLLELLVSPTRQAVVLARSYDAKERKLQMQGAEVDYSADNANIPAFIFVIDKVAQQAAELGVRAEELPQVSEGQFSIFDEPENAEVNELLELDGDIPAQEHVETAADPVEVAESDEESEDLRSEIDDTADALDAFLADFTITNGELVPTKVAEEESEAEEATEYIEAEEEAAQAEITGDAKAEEEPVQYRRKTNILLLILYIFLAIPVGLIGVAVLLLPTVLFLALSVSCVYLGVSLIGCCFGSFAVIADTLVVFGAGLVLAALSLLFVWMFIWFLGGAIVGFIRGLCILGRKICCKEVAVQ